MSGNAVGRTPHGRPTVAMVELIESLDLPPATFAVYSAMCTFAGADNRECWASTDRIARRAGFSRRTVQRALYAGDTAGVWRRVPGGRDERGRQRTTSYVLHDWHLAHLAPTAPEPAESARHDDAWTAEDEVAVRHGDARECPTDEPAARHGDAARAPHSRGPCATRSRAVRHGDAGTNRGNTPGDLAPSATADGHARPAHAEPDDARAADVPAVRGDARPEVVGSTPGLDRRAAEAPSPSPVSPTAVVPHVDRARLRRDVGREGRIVSHAIDVLRQTGADTPASARGPILAVLRTHGDDEPDALADRLDAVLARLAGHDVEAAAS